MADTPDEQANTIPDLASAATAYANADAAVKSLELKRDIKAKELADLDAYITAAMQSRDKALTMLRGTV